MSGSSVSLGPTAAIHALPGLEPDNLLGFLTLLGLLRALEESHSEWRPKAAWQGEPLGVSLHLAEAVARPQVIDATEKGIRSIAKAYDILGQTVSQSSKRCSKTCEAIPDGEFFEVMNFRSLSERYRWDRARGQLIASLGSDGFTKRDGEEVVTSPLRTMFGQGHQHFPSRLKLIATRVNSGDAHNLEIALFEPWTYGDSTDSFRWDPIEDRRYAYQAGDPAKARNKVGTVAGANRLASLGFGVLSCAPTSSGLGTIGFRGKPHQEMCWPLPGVPTSLPGFMAALSHPALLEDNSISLRSYGIIAVARASRVQIGKYFNFERARLDFLR